MSEVKHTPGPWHVGVRQPNSDKFVYGADGEEVANCDRLTNFPDVNLANARLVAAAPDLLEALEACESLLSAKAGKDPRVWRSVPMTLARSAIAKAKGEK